MTEENKTNVVKIVSEAVRVACKEVASETKQARMHPFYGTIGRKERERLTRKNMFIPSTDKRPISEIMREREGK